MFVSFKSIAGTAIGITALVSTTSPAGAMSSDASAAKLALEIVGSVPITCRVVVDAGSPELSPGRFQLGTLQEFCNSPTGYEIYADHSPELANGNFFVAGRKIPLSTSGSTRIRESDRAAIYSNDLALEVPEGVTSGQISFRIMPR